MPLPTLNKPLPRTALELVCEALANVTRLRRELRGLSLNGLAELTSLSRQMISFIETNRRIPTIDTVARISRVLGVGFACCAAHSTGHPLFFLALSPHRGEYFNWVLHKGTFA